MKDQISFPDWMDHLYGDWDNNADMQCMSVVYTSYNKPVFQATGHGAALVWQASDVSPAVRRQQLSKIKFLSVPESVLRYARVSMIYFGRLWIRTGRGYYT